MSTHTNGLDKSKLWRGHIISVLDTDYVVPPLVYGEREDLDYDTLTEQMGDAARLSRILVDAQKRDQIKRTAEEDWLGEESATIKQLRQRVREMNKVATQGMILIVTTVLHRNYHEIDEHWVKAHFSQDLLLEAFGYACSAPQIAREGTPAGEVEAA
jgi:hypothetical protein